MKIRDVTHFFEELDKRVSFPMTVILTGGAAAALFGKSRATQDIDFEVHFRVRKKESSDAWEEFKRHLNEVAVRTKIIPQYSENIDRWSLIALPKKTSRLFRKAGKIEIRLLDPGLWAIGKLTRFLPVDVRDLCAVLSKTKPNPQKLARLWGQALRESPPSPAQGQFRRQVEQFFSQNARQIWGRWASPEKLIALFLSSARLK